jgi:peptidoglycan L-alanyl-D-glutamate endopeptidase CwlK
MFTLSKRSLDRLEGVHPDLVKVVKRAIEITEIDFAVLEGVRSLETQQEYLKKGATTTLRSRHLTGHAVDLGAFLGGSVRWEWPLYEKLSQAVMSASKELGVPIEWGGDWKKFKDGPHFQLPWAIYP